MSFSYAVRFLTSLFDRIEKKTIKREFEFVLSKNFNDTVMIFVFWSNQIIVKTEQFIKELFISKIQYLRS